MVGWRRTAAAACLYTHVHITQICKDTYVHTYEHTHTDTHVCIHTRIRVCIQTCVSVCVCSYVCTYVSLHICVMCTCVYKHAAAAVRLHPTTLSRPLYPTLIGKITCSGERDICSHFCQRSYFIGRVVPCVSDVKQI